MNPAHLRPTGLRILVEPIDPPRTSHGGILLPDPENAPGDLPRARVLAISPRAREKLPELEIGAIVILPHRLEGQIACEADDGRRLLFVAPSAIFGVEAAS